MTPSLSDTLRTLTAVELNAYNRAAAYETDARVELAKYRRSAEWARQDGRPYPNVEERVAEMESRCARHAAVVAEWERVARERYESMEAA